MRTAERGLRILVIDDDDLDREAVRRALSKLVPPPEIAEASGIGEGLEQLTGAAFDCVVLDYRLPEGPCLEFLGRLRAEAPHAAFVVLTGQGDEQIAVELMKAGASDYLSKDGLDPGRLRRALQYAVALRSAEIHAVESEAHRRRHTEQLRHFLERAPALVRARSLTELVEAAASLGREVLGAEDVFVLTRDADAEYSALRGHSSPTSLVQWATAALAEHADAVASDGRLCLAARLRSRDGEARGMIALGFAETGAQQVAEHILGQLAVLVSVCRDNLVLYDAAARAIRARDDVMAVVSHDLRNPLNNIRLGVSLLRDGASEQEQPIITRVDRNVTMMGRLVDDLVDMVRLEGGKLELSLRSEPVHELLESASQLIVDTARKQNIRFSFDAHTAEQRVFADRDRVLQVLSNLLGNALKFTPDGGEVSLRAVNDGNRVRFEVRDTGCGIAAEEGDKVFSRFWRSDPKRRQGLGLGLYIAKGLVQAQGGRLWYQSEESRGTTFFFTLPAQQATDGERPSPVPEREHLVIALPAPRRAAVVEDDEDTRSLIGKALTRAGFEVRDFGDAESFMAAGVFEDLSIVVSDVGLPGRDGLELCAALRESRCELPILLVTAFRDEPVFQRALAAGCEILTKPLNFGQLAERAGQLARTP